MSDLSGGRLETKMKRALWTTGCGFAVCMAGCLGNPIVLTAGGSAVQLMKADPPPGCAEVGPARGEFSNGEDTAARLEDAKRDMRNKAADKGANYVRMEAILPLGQGVTGTAYKCPEGERVKESAAIAAPGAALK